MDVDVRQQVVSTWVTNLKLKTNQGERAFFSKFAQGPATLYNMDGSVKETNTFNMGCLGEAGSGLRGGWY